MSISLRLAEPNDALMIWRLICELAEYEREPDAVEVTPETLQAQLTSNHPPFECLLADAGGEVVGFALFYQNYSTWKGKPGLYLEDLYVAPEYRGTGTGKALMQKLAEIALERGYGRMEWVVLNRNTPAHRFYKRLGAKPLIDWTTWRLDRDAIACLADGH